MRGSVACLAKWDCQSFSRWHEFKECGQRCGGESEEAKLREKGRGRMGEEEEEEEREVKEESRGWKAPEV